MPAGLEGELTSEESTQVKSGAGRPKKHPGESACGKPVLILKTIFETSKLQMF